MRKSDDGTNCEETLGEYYSLCLELFGKKAVATQYILMRINKSIEGKREKVIETDAEMRAFLIQLEMDSYGIKGKA